MPSFWPSLRSPGDSFWLEGRLDWHDSHGSVGGYWDPTGLVSPSLFFWWSKLDWNVTLIKSRKQSVIFLSLEVGCVGHWGRSHYSSTPRHQTLDGANHIIDLKQNIQTSGRGEEQFHHEGNIFHHCIVFFRRYFPILRFQIFMLPTRQLAYFFSQVICFGENPNQIILKHI